MSSTITEKILAKHAGKKEVKPKEMITVSVDKVLIHDLFSPFCINQFKKMGFNNVWSKQKVVFVFDHLVPTTSPRDSEHHHKTMEFAEEQDIENVYVADGVCHQIMVESFVEPGKLILGADSHTCTYGALGAFATSLGYTEMAGVLGTGSIWLRVPKSIKFVVDGKLSKGVFAKDLILKIIWDIGADGATYRAMEFCGSTIERFSLSSRLTLCNMAIEAGAKNGIIAPDKKVGDFLKQQGRPVEQNNFVESDKDAQYEEVFEYDVAELEPMVACPHTVDNVKPISEIGEVRIDQAFLGSCTNGRLEDLRIAAKILKGKTIHKNTKLIVTPASKKVFLEALNEGLIETFLDSGAIMMNPNCSSCWGGCQGVMSDGEKMVTSGNRNFKGRVGSPKSEIYLASPATVAFSALNGRIVNEWT